MTAMAALRFFIDDIRFFERDVALRLPFRFGVATLTSCPQVHVQARIRFADGSTMPGCAAEMMVPKWFDKNTALSNENNFEQLRTALKLARSAYTAEPVARTAWGHFAAHYDAVLAAGAQAGLNPLVASYGPALIDRAVLDALCLHLQCSFAQAMAANAAGAAPRDLDATRDLASFDIDAFLARRMPVTQIAARHTVGLLDAIGQADRPLDAPNDGLPCTLAEVVARYGHRHFKLKLGGDAAADLARLREISNLISTRAEVVTLDGNEQYADAAAFADFLDRFEAAPALAPLRARVAFVEQPIRRDQTLQCDVSALARRMPLLVDESDSTLRSFVQARAVGYTGISSKSCKGVYKSILNAARCALWSAAEGKTYFQSGEDLTMQAGVGVQQDLALVGWLGLPHVERNGHHYVNGMAALPAQEQLAFQADHPTLYETSAGAVRLALRDGLIDLHSLACPGFATAKPGAGISWDAMRSAY